MAVDRLSVYAYNISSGGTMENEAMEHVTEQPVSTGNPIIDALRNKVQENNYDFLDPLRLPQRQKDAAIVLCKIAADQSRLSGLVDASRLVQNNGIFDSHLTCLKRKGLLSRGLGKPFTLKAKLFASLLPNQSSNGNEHNEDFEVPATPQHFPKNKLILEELRAKSVDGMVVLDKELRVYLEKKYETKGQRIHAIINEEVERGKIKVANRVNRLEGKQITFNEHIEVPVKNPTVPEQVSEVPAVKLQQQQSPQPVVLPTQAFEPDAEGHTEDLKVRVSITKVKNYYEKQVSALREKKEQILAEFNKQIALIDAEIDKKIIQRKETISALINASNG